MNLPISINPAIAPLPMCWANVSVPPSPRFIPGQWVRQKDEMQPPREWRRYLITGLAAKLVPGPNGEARTVWVYNLEFNCNVQHDGLNLVAEDGSKPPRQIAQADFILQVLVLRWTEIEAPPAPTLVPSQWVYLREDARASFEWSKHLITGMAVSCELLDSSSPEFNWHYCLNWDAGLHFDRAELVNNAEREAAIAVWDLEYGDAESGFKEIWGQP